MLDSVSQTQTIKVVKETAKPSLIQSEAPWHVTFCDYYNGTVKIFDLYNPKNNLRISNNTIGLKIKSFEVIYKSKGKLCSWSTSGDSLPQNIRSALLLVDKNSKLFICDIKAISKFQDTILLNSIELKIIE